MTWPSIRASRPLTSAFTMFMPGSDEVTDESMRGLVEQFGRRAALHHAAVMHDDDGVGEGERLGLVVGDIDHREIELAMQRLQL